MNILIVQHKAFPHRDNSFSWFYTQLVEWLTAQGYPSALYYAYPKLSDKGYDNGLLLPEPVDTFYTEVNVAAISEYIVAKQIDVILDYSSIIVGGVKRFYKAIRKAHPQLKLFTMIHSCPNHTVKLAHYTLSVMKQNQARSLKQKVQFYLPNLYLKLLQKEVRRQNRNAYRVMDEVVVLSPSYIGEFRKLIGDDSANRISAIPNAIRPVESGIDFDDKRKEIIFAGRMSVEKALPKLLSIWQRVQDRLPDWSLVLLGDGPQRAVCEEIIATQQLQRVKLPGYQMAIPFIDRSAILCLTSVIEGLPTVFTEAMSLGVVPITYGSFGAAYDMIANGVNGFIISEDDETTYAETLYKLATDTDVRRRMAQMGQASKNRYSIDQVGELWMKAFKKHQLI